MTHMFLCDFIFNAKEVLGFDDANKAFRPWWDTTQDFLMYGMVVLGMYIVLYR